VNCEVTKAKEMQMNNNYKNVKKKKLFYVLMSAIYGDDEKSPHHFISNKIHWFSAVMGNCPSEGF